MDGEITIACQMMSSALAPNTQALVADFVGYKLRQKGYVLGAALCAGSVNKEMKPLEGQVQEWMVA
jgi:Ca2+/H+ antiporter